MSKAMTSANGRASGDAAARALAHEYVIPQGASAEAIQAHYDLENDFFKLWLDEHLLYTCALWSPGEAGEGLEGAQAAKVDFYWDRLIKAPGARILDIGCGWGGALQRAVTQHAVSEAVGITLSAAQHAYVDDLMAPGLTCHEVSWSDFEPD